MSVIDEQQFEEFCNDADLKTPARAAEALRRYHVPDEIVNQLVERYEHHVGIVKDAKSPGFLQSGGRMTWYTGPRPNDRCWPRLVSLLEEQGFEEQAIADLHASTNRIVSLLEHPATVEFTTKGLVLGHVQSGKTTNYTGVISKAADRGYRLFIVLAGVHNELRRQTQNRLISQLISPNREYWHQLTDPDKDFYPLSNAPAYFAKYSDQTVLCVVKKNAAVLRRLIAWLGEADRQLALIPALVIDDEADQAAVATQTINPLVRSLLHVLPRVAYIGYSATPFANLLIDPDSGDLYPGHFIVDLPKPAGHFGTESIFGRDPIDGEDPADYEDDRLDMVRIVPDDEVPFVRPASNAEVDGFSPSVSGELRRSILYFWLATAARRVRGTGVPHSTMLIHTSLRVAVHISYEAPIRDLRQDVLERLQREDTTFLDDMRELWDHERGRVTAESMGETPVSFDTLLDHLEGVVDESRVVLDNSRSTDRLDYGGDPVVAIAVGGNTLSRGLTLEGLVVSFFVRSSTAYDTLLQMGRWFGYRGGYSDLPRIWMTRELEGWFRHIAEVEAEIRQDISRYENDNVTPETFAVRIQAHPTLTITAAAKMKDAVLTAAAFGGLRIQTRYFKADDEEWLVANQDAARALVKAIGGRSAARPSPEISGFIWGDAPNDAVLAFLEEYRVHEKSPDNATDLLARYVRHRNERGRLQQWNIALIGSSSAGCGSFIFGDELEVPRIIRSRLEYSVARDADIKTLMSTRDAAVDLDLTGVTKLTEGEIARRRIEQTPDTPLLVLYAIDPTSSTKRQGRIPLDAVTDAIGAGIVFPKPPPGDDDKVYWSADLSRIAANRDAYFEDEDLSVLEEEQL